MTDPLCECRDDEGAVCGECRSCCSCPECHGRGEVWAEAPWARWFDCGVCGGSGIAPVGIEVGRA